MLTPEPTNYFIIPDIHEKWRKLHWIDNKLGVETPRIYLGDWFDAFDPEPEDVLHTCEFLAKELQSPHPRVFLWGNHDWHYYKQRDPDDNFMVCSGHSDRTQQIIDNLLPVDWADKFQFYIRTPHHLISHAGFRVDPMDMQEPAEWWPYMVGRSRKGVFGYGGPLWLDWYQEFLPIEGTQQIVGHTNQRNNLLGLTANGDICLDNGLKAVLDWRDGLGTLVPVKEQK
jgi:hypothetical protein